MIVKSTPKDINEIFKIYDAATAYQKKVAVKTWRGFERTLIEQEVNEGRHYLIKYGDIIACTFVIAFEDPIIWKEKNADAAIYLHRIATDPAFKGGAYVKKIVAWAKIFALENNLDFIRLDTHSGNEKINKHYMSCGFTYIGVSAIEWPNDLPEHYKEGSFSIFEIEL